MQTYYVKLISTTKVAKNLMIKFRPMKNVYLYGPIEAGKTLADLQKQVGDNYVGGINLYMDSDGGNVSEADAIIAYLKSLNCPITITLQSVASAASTIALAFPDSLKIAPNVKPEDDLIMIHNTRVEPSKVKEGYWTAKDLNEMAAIADTKDKELAEGYALALKKPISEVLVMMENETTLSASDARAMKLAAINSKTNKMETTPKKNSLSWLEKVGIKALRNELDTTDTGMVADATSDMIEVKKMLTDLFSAVGEIRSLLDALTELQKKDIAEDLTEASNCGPADKMAAEIEAKRAELKKLEEATAKAQLVAIDVNKGQRNLVNANASTPLHPWAQAAILNYKG